MKVPVPVLRRFNMDMKIQVIHDTAIAATENNESQMGTEEGHLVPPRGSGQA